MKIDEFIKQLRQQGFEVKYLTNNLLEVSKNQLRLQANIYAQPDDEGQWSIDDNLKFYELYLQFAHTPLKDRFPPQKKYYLVAHPDSLKEFWTDDFKYVASIEDGAAGFKFVYGKPTVFTEGDLDSIKIMHPFLAPTIDAMKEEVKNDEKQD